MIIYKVINYKFNIINYYNKNIFSIKSSKSKKMYE